MENTCPDVLNEKSSHLLRVEGKTPDGEGIAVLLRVTLERHKTFFRGGVGTDKMEIEARPLDVESQRIEYGAWYGVVMKARGEASGVSKNVCFSNGMVVVDPEWLRGLHIGTYVFNLLIAWAKDAYSDFEVVPIKLLINQARSDEDRDHRNRFYERFGFRFLFSDSEQREGASDPRLRVGELSTVDSWERNITVVDEANYVRELLKQLRNSQGDKEKALSTAKNLSDGHMERYMAAGKFCRRVILVYSGVAFLVGIFVCSNFPVVGKLFGQ